LNKALSLAAGQIIFNLLLAGIIIADDSGDFHFRFGLGYDFVSQEYFIDSLRLGVPDSAVELTLLQRDYLDDKKGLFYVKFDPNQSGRYVVETGWEQTPELYRARGKGHIVFGGGKNRLTVDARLDIKERYRGSVDPGEEMSVLEGRVYWKKRLSGRFESRIRFFGENVSFDSAGSFLFNYSRFGGEIAIDLFTRDLSSVYTRVAIEARKVPDSARMGYELIRGGVGYLGSFLAGQMVGELTVEAKNYDRIEGLDDHILTTLHLDMRIPVAERFALKPNISAEYFNFKAEGYLSDDYLLSRGGLLLERDYEEFSISLGPKIEALKIESEYLNDDDYFEYLLLAGFDYYQIEKAFIMFENQFGRRTYRNDPLFYSDFDFLRLNLIANIRVLSGLSFDVIFSADWEWHRIKSDDSRLYLLSAGLTYSF
jgi:hypothetical protein